MTAVMGGDLVAVANIVGKAIDTPVQGMTALSRQGFIFTKAQKELVRSLEESGKHFEAQKVILEEIETTFKGTASAIASVTENQTRLEYQQNRYKIAQGEATSKSKEMWASIRADWKEAAADAVELYNKIQHAYNYNPAKDREEVEAKKKKSEEIFETEAERINAVRKYERAVLDQTLKEAKVLYTKHLDESVRKHNLYWGNQLIEFGARLLDTFDFSHALDAFDTTPMQNQLAQSAALAESYASEMAKLNAEIAEHNRITEEMFTKQQLLDADLEKIEAQKKLLKEIQETRKTTLEEIKRINEEEGTGLVNAGEAQRRRMSAYETEVVAVNRLITSVKDLAFESVDSLEQQNELMNTLNAALSTATNQYRELYNQVESGQKRVTAADHIAFLKETMQSRHNALVSLKDDLDRGAVDLEKFNAEMLKINQNAVNAIETFHRQSGIKWTENDGEAGEIGTLTNQIYADFEKGTISIQQLFDQLGVNLEEIRRKEQAAAVAAWNKDTQNEIELAFARQKGDLEAIREIEKRITEEKLKQSDVYKNAEEDTQASMLDEQERLRKLRAGADLTEMLNEHKRLVKETGASSKATIEMQRQEALQAASVFSDMGGEYDELVKNINEYYDLLEKKDSWEKFKQNAQYAVDQTIQLFSAISQAILSFQKSDLDAYKADLDAKNEALQLALDDELQQRLFAAGLGGANTKEQFAQELEDAIATGNHRLIYEKEKAKKQYEIEKDINDRKEKAEKELNEKKAQLDYEYAVNQWKVELALAHAHAAQAIITAAASAAWPWNLIPISFATGIGIAQIAAIRGAQPVSQKFEEGGIVRGSPFRGDIQPIMAKGREMVLTEQDQKNLFDMIRNGAANQKIQLHTVIEMDGEVIAEKIFEIASNGNAFIRARGIIR
jgi:hypothetical protein